MKVENYIKINNLVKVQLGELEEIRNENKTLKQSIHFTRESFNPTLLSKDDELEELNRKYLGELQDIKQFFDGKEDSFGVALAAKDSEL